MRREVVTTVPQVAANLQTFNGGAAAWPGSRKLLRDTWYWIYDSTTGDFAPSKFAGLANMTFREYETLQRLRDPNVGFNGARTRKAVESALGQRYTPDLVLEGSLEQWADRTLGPGTLDGLGARRKRWAFVRI